MCAACILGIELLSRICYPCHFVVSIGKYQYECYLKLELKELFVRSMNGFCLLLRLVFSEVIVLLKFLFLKILETGLNGNIGYI